LLALCAELATEGKPENSRQLAGLYIKNLISAKVDKYLIRSTDSIILFITCLFYKDLDLPLLHYFTMKSPNHFLGSNDFRTKS
jgi:hypothetical protein